MSLIYWVTFDFQLLRLDYDVNSNADPMGNPNEVIGTIFMLFFDGVFYLLLTFYFEKVLPSKSFHDKTYWHACKSHFFLIDYSFYIVRF